MSDKNFSPAPDQAPCHPCKPMETPASGLSPIDPAWLNNPKVHTVLDVRELPPPEPLQKILEATALLPKDMELIVYHNRIPALLYPRLQERSMWVETVEQVEHGVVLIRIGHTTHQP
ncbi:DUF2249 domain-containing protein [Magnetococcus sp. PR-3]|uniref:DUF2249 domain-containing protein n=1 Tax=Magnetococcus sp. PR-3 TaxID=3120355 RepID=UPI002FCDEBF8